MSPSPFSKSNPYDPPDVELGLTDPTSESSGIPSPLWRRAVAVLIDMIFLVFLLTIIAIFISSFVVPLLWLATVGRFERWIPLGLDPILSFGLFLGVPTVYLAGMESSSLEATIGKIATGIKVTDLRGRRIHFASSLIRQFGKLLSALPLGLGFLLGVFSKQHRAFHDLLAGTRVVLEPLTSRKPVVEQSSKHG